MFQTTGHSRIVYVPAPYVATAADEGDVEGFITTRGHCRHGEWEGKGKGKDY